MLPPSLPPALPSFLPLNISRVYILDAVLGIGDWLEVVAVAPSIQESCVEGRPSRGSWTQHSERAGRGS